MAECPINRPQDVPRGAQRGGGGANGSLVCLKSAEKEWNQAANTEGEPLITLGARVLEPGTKVAAVPALGISLLH